MADNSYLLGLFGGSSAGIGPGGFSPPVPPRKTQPTAPWSPAAATSEPSALVRSALSGRRIINEAATDVDLKGASADYRRLFALYKGLDTLSALADRAGARGVGASEQALIARRFASGLEEVSTFMAGAPFQDVRLVQGASAAAARTTAAVARDSQRWVTAPVHEGALTTEVEAFGGDVRFGVTVTTPTGSGVIDIDLADLGATPRTLDAVVGHINAALEGAGVQTRFGREMLKAEPRTLRAGATTITLPAGPDRWSLVVNGASTETVAFSAVQATDAVYVVQAAGDKGGHQLLKFQSDAGGAPPPAVARVGETQWVEGRASQTGLPPGVETVRAGAAGPDGAVWLVADLDAGSDTRPIKGRRDVALIKLDSAGRVVATRSLGAASTASGYAIAVDADGRVAVAGSVTGALEPGARVAEPALADSFVTVFDAAGDELWTQRRGARAEDEATAVVFGPDGRVHVAGRTRSAMPGASALGGWDGYLQSFSESRVHSLAPVVATPGAVTQFGSGGDDGVDAVAIEGSDLYTAGVENGRAVVRRFSLDGGGAPTLTATRDLGAADGEIAGVAVSGGRVILTGTTRNPALSAGAVNRAHSGGTDAFVAVLSTDLAAAGSDRLTYYGAGGDDTAADVKIHDAKVWITGVSDRAPGARAEDPTQAYLARLDPLSGAVEWSRTWAGEAQQAIPLTLAVGSGGASVLDRLGLPTGAIGQSGSKRLTAATSLRSGDRFQVAPADGGRSATVTVAADDTLQTLARRIELASSNRLRVTVVSEGGSITDRDGEFDTTTGGFQRLSITAREGRGGAVLSSGEPGRDALAGLGLASGFIGPATNQDGGKTFGLDLPRALGLGDAAAIKAADERLQVAMKAVRDAYRSLSPAARAPAITGPAPAYLTAQLANYQAALQRLAG